MSKIQAVKYLSAFYLIYAFNKTLSMLKSVHKERQCKLVVKENYDVKLIVNNCKIYTYPNCSRNTR